MTKSVIVLAGAILTLTLCSAAGLAADPVQTGDRVVGKKAVALRVSGKTVESVRPDVVLKVEQIQGEWLWVQSPSGKKGWVQASEVALAPNDPDGGADRQPALTPEFDALAQEELLRGELVVTVHADVQREDLEQALSSLRHKATILDEIPAAKTWLIGVPADVLHECRLRLGLHPYVEACGLNTIQELARTFDDPVLAEDDENGWNLRRINAPAAWDVTTGGAAIGIVDSGVKLDHDEFLGKISDSFSIFTKSQSMMSGLVNVKHGDQLIPEFITEHGSHVAGTAAARAGNGLGTAGVAPDSPIIPIQSLGYHPDSQRIFGSDFALIQGLNRAMDMGARVINYSVGGSPPIRLVKAWREAMNEQEQADAEAQLMNWVQRRLNDDYVGVLDRALREGVILVKSAGNDDLPARFDHLCFSARVIAVAASDVDDHRAAFSNYGGHTTVSAPGTDIWSAYANPDVPFGSMQGTSMAAPHATGLVALMKTIDPDLTRMEAAEILVATGQPLSTDKPIGPLINAAAAVQELKRRRDNNVPRPAPELPLLGPRPNPRNPVLPPQGVAILQGPQPWQNPDVRRLIDLWLSIALPVIGDRNPADGPFFFDRFGRIISIRIVYTILPPDYAATRYQWLWTNANVLVSVNYGSLDVFVTDMMKSGAFNPIPPPRNAVADAGPSEANGTHNVGADFNRLAKTFVWQQAQGADTAEVTFNMNGPEGAILSQHGLAAQVTVTAKKQGGKFVVAAGNPMSTAVSNASANLSRSVGGVPAKFSVSLEFTPNGKQVSMKASVKVGG